MARKPPRPPPSKPRPSSLRVLAPDDEGLGRPTVMNPALAAQYGVPYVRLAAFAIDVDRARVAAGDADDRPQGWEVFLTEVYVLENFDPQSELARLIIEDVCLDIVDAPPDVDQLGAQIALAVYDACARGEWPPEMAAPLRNAWKKGPDALVERLASLWRELDPRVVALARSCLAAKLDPPLAPPTADALRWMIESRSRTGSGTH